MSDDCKRYHIWLNREDALWFQQVFGDNMGFSKAIRLVMRTYKNGIEAKIAQERKQGRKISDVERDEITRLAAIDPEGPGRDPKDR